MEDTAFTRPRHQQRSSFQEPQCSDYRPLVLFAEDNELVAKAGARFFEAAGFRVALVTVSGAAIEVVRQQSPDIILMDIQMPGIDGVEAIERIRQMSEHEETPIVALGGLAMEDAADRCLAAGASHYVSKPYRLQKLVELIREQLQ